MRKLLQIVFWLGSFSAVAQGIHGIDEGQGLMHPSVYAAAEDAFGFAWIGTRDGLYRFNESRAVRVELEGPWGDVDNVQSLLATSDSMLYVGLQGGLALWDVRAHRFGRWKNASELDGMTISALYEDSRGSIWIGTQGDGLWERRKDGTLQRWYGLKDVSALDFVFDFVQDGKQLWIGASGERLWYIDLDLGQLVEAASGPRFSSFRKTVAKSAFGMVYGVEEQGVYVLQEGAWVLLQPEDRLLRPRAVAAHGNQIWISTDGDGLHVWDGQHWLRYSKNDPQLGIGTNQFYNIDRVGEEFWVGSFNGGITCFPLLDEDFTKLRKPEEFVFTSIQSALTLEPSDQELWVGFDGDALVRYELDESMWTPHAVADGAIPRVITSMELHPDGGMWLGTFNEGLWRVDAQGSVIENYMPFTAYGRGLGNANIWSLTYGAGDSLWVGTLGGLYLWDGDQFSQPWSEPWAAGRNIMDLEYDGTYLWVATEFQGLYRIDADLNIQNFEVNAPILDVELWNGEVFLGTEGEGVLHLVDGGFDRLVSGIAYGLEAMGDQFWITSSKGLLQVEMRDGAFDAGTWASSEDLQIGLFNRKALLAFGDELFVGGTGGVVSVDVHANVAKPAPKLAVEELFFDNERANAEVFTGRVERALVAPAGTKVVEASVAILSAFEQPGLSLSYRVVGRGEQWLQVMGNSRVVNVGSLAPGEYSLEVRLSTEAGVELDRVVLPLVQGAFVWQTTWFRVLSVLVILVLGGSGVAVYQDRKLRATKVLLLETERELLEVKAGEAEAKAKQKSDELSFQLLKTSSRVELLQDFKSRLEEESQTGSKSDETKKMLRGLIRELNRELQSENYWEYFEQNYRDLHVDFSEELVRKHPKLTKGEVRLSYLVRQNMSNKEISTVLNVSPAAVEKAKYRLKKKLDLGKDDSLNDYIIGL